MPEGPEVKIISDQLKCIIGRQITSISTADNKFADLHQIKLPIYIRDITCYGKRIMIHIDNNIIMVNFLGMEGKWTFTEGKHTRVKMNLQTKPNEYAPGFTLTIYSTIYF